MSRPLMQRGIGQLEGMFAKGMAEPKVLKQLESELQYRQVPRAIALHAEVQAALYGATPAPASRPVPEPVPARPPASQQSTLWERPAVPPAASESASPPVPTTPLEDAYKLLKATAGSTWESIEQTRRQLVQQAHPGRLQSVRPDRRAQVLAEARRVNAAYSALSHTRCGGR